MGTTVLTIVIAVKVAAIAGYLAVQWPNWRERKRRQRADERRRSQALASKL